MKRHLIRVSVSVLCFGLGVAGAWSVNWTDTKLHPAQLSTSRSYPPGFFDRAEESAAIYAAVIHERTGNSKGSAIITADAVAFADSRRRDSDDREQARRELAGGFPEAVDDDAIDDYLEQNGTEGKLLLSRLSPHFVVVTDRELEALRGYFWTAFDKKYPGLGGLFAFSRIGFNSAHDQAFLYSSYSCGGLCGDGRYVLLEKVNGAWTIRASQGIWVS